MIFAAKIYVKFYLLSMFCCYRGTQYSKLYICFYGMKTIENEN